MSLLINRVLSTARCLLLAAMSASASGASAAAEAPGGESSLDKIRRTQVVAVGARGDALPFSYNTAGAAPMGYAIDICDQIVAAMRRDFKLPRLKLEHVPVTGANRFDLVRTGKVDMECGLSVNNVERRKEVDYAMPYAFSGPRILTRIDSPIRDFRDLAGKRVVLAKGANAIPILQKQKEQGILRDLRLIEVANNEAAFQALERGEADAFVTIDVLLYAYRAKAAQPKDWTVVGGYLVLEPLAIVLRKDDVEMREYLNKVLAGLMLDGTVGKLYRKWFLQPIPPKGGVLEMPMNSVMRDQLNFPSDKPGDKIGG